MATHKKGTVDGGELEKGRELHAVQDSGRRQGSKTTGKDVVYKIMSALALLVLCWHYGFTFARPADLARRIDGVPQFVLDYAPMVYLDVGEAFFPSDIGCQLEFTHPEVNYTVVPEAPFPLTVENLDALNGIGSGGRKVYLTANQDITQSPTPLWLLGVVPDSSGKTVSATSAAIIVNDRGNGSTDAYYMYFYAYNQGNTVFGQELGDHIGDWEHNMVRFEDGVPLAVWYSQHNNGQAFTYKAVEKIGKRPVSYSAKGSHANYGTTGKHDHTIPDLNLPDGFLVDVTSKGMLWDPTLNAYYYNFNGSTSGFDSINSSPVAAMNYNGKWGDAQYPDSDSRQKTFFGFKKYVDGPTGPGDKQLNRTDICPQNGFVCILRDKLGP